jgi:PKD repeat protein
MSHNMRVFPSAIAVLIWVFGMSAPLHAAQLQLTWNAPSTNTDNTPLTDLAGYRLYYGEQSGIYTQNIDVGNLTTYMLAGLNGGQTYYFVMTAYDTSENESAFSDETNATTLPDPAPPPVASFTGAPLSGSAPLAVNFTDTSTGQITTWTWSFGDNSGSAARHPQHTYTGAGTYTVTLTVNGPGGTHAATRQGYISVTPPPVPSTGLVAAYSFNEGTGSTITDVSGSGNHGTISGAQWTNAGRYGKALVFDGVNDWVTVADRPSLDLTSGMTLEAWAYPTALSGGSTNGWRTAVLKQQSSQLVYALYANSDSNRPSGYVYTGSDRGVSGNTQLRLNAWSHLATTYDGSILRLYVNGTLVGSQSLSGVIRTSGHPLRIGGNSVWGEYFKGRIDDVRVYNRALTTSQIQADMNTPVSATSGHALASSWALPVRLRQVFREDTRIKRSTATALLGPTFDSPRGTSQRVISASKASPVSSGVRPYLLEAGEVEVTPQWQRITFSSAFVEPIVVVSAASIPASAMPRLAIRHVAPTGFDIRVQPLDDVTGTHPAALASFLVLERGTYTLEDGSQMEAGSIPAPPSDTSHMLSFSRRFDRVPVVMTTITSVGESAAMASRLQSVTRSGLRVHLHGQDADAQASLPKTLSYVAWEPSAGTLQDVRFETNRIGGIGHETWQLLPFQGVFDVPPILLVEAQRGLSGNPVSLRRHATRADGVEVTIDAGARGDDAEGTTTQVVGFIALR